MAWGTTRPDVTCDSPVAMSDNGYADIRLPGPLLIRILIWLLIFAAFPLSVTAARLSFNLEVLRRTTSEPGRSAEKEVAPRVSLAERVLLHLEKAERKESDPWLRDDIRIAWICVIEASRGNSQPHIDATYRVLGLHPDKVWPAILERREALLGKSFGLIGADAPPTSQRASKQVGELSPIDIPLTPQTKKQPMAANREGNAPQKTCAYGAAGNTSSTAPRAEECRFSTGSSCRTETKREARRIRTSEFGLHDAPPAGVAAPAVNTIPQKKRSASVRNLAQEKGII